MGDKPIIISNNMNNINTPTQHIRNNKTFAEITSNEVLPKMNQAIVFDSTTISNKLNMSLHAAKLYPQKIYNLYHVFQIIDFAFFSIIKLLSKIY